MNSARQRTGVKRALVTVTGTTPQAIIPAQSGYTPSLLQILINEGVGDQLRKITFMEESEDIFPFTLGASGTIVWDIVGAPETLGVGSGLYARLDDSGSVTVLARYILHDDRTPTNLNPATYVPKTIRTPNALGGQ